MSAAWENVPDIILLDVEMPGMNGYEVCEQLRANALTADTPIIFLSSHSSLRERLQGYDAGADDYLVKPFEPESLLARINVLERYREQRRELQAQYELAQKTAHSAISTSSELGMAVQFVERSYNHRSYEELAQGLFDTTDKLGLSCCLLIIDEDGEHRWYSSEGSIKPLEQELIELSDRHQRFLDFGARTLVNFENASLLVRNMPLADRERYGRVKDLVPVLLSAVNSKLSAMLVEQGLLRQSKELLESFAQIRTNFYYLAKQLLQSQCESTHLLREMVNELNYDLLRMGLDEDQEQFLIERIDAAINNAADVVDTRHVIHDAFSAVLRSLKQIRGDQEALVEAFNRPQESVGNDMQDDDDIELF
jgi:ActR/RegA family two-component response regulator